MDPALYKDMPFQLPFTLFAMSDAHLELLGKGNVANEVGEAIVAKMPKADVCVLAGDIGDANHGCFVRFLKACAAKYTLVLFVPGNHEFWFANAEFLKLACEMSGVKYLDNASYIYKGVCFIGSTLWTALDDDDRHESYTINDFKHIPGFMFENWMDRHAESRKYILDTLKKQPLGTQTVVITHHAPSLKCIPPAYRGSPSNVFYATNLEAWFNGTHAPVAWISGHTHWRHMETVGKTLLVSNPRLNPDGGVHPAWCQPQVFWHAAN
jgi:predicted phosphohydrolase